MKKWLRLRAGLIAASIVFTSIAGSLTISSMTAYASDEDNEYPVNLTFSVDGGEEENVKAINAYYANNYYVSLRDISAMLAGTDKAFVANVTESSVDIVTGQSFVMDEDMNVNTSWTSEWLGETLSKEAFLHSITKDGEDVMYYNFLMEVEGIRECFMSLSDLAMMLDTDISCQDGVWNISTSTPLTVDLDEMNSYGYFDGINSVLVGDVTSGEIFYGYEIDRSYAIASITKLMTYVVVEDAINAGEMSEADSVTIPQEAAVMSRGADGTFEMKAGQTATVSDLLKAMLIPSSNEAALSLAVHLCGDEDAFVDRMNDKAAELGLTSARFYSCNGLPIYTEGLFTAKRQNTMSTLDLFRLIAYIYETYPEITDITSIKSCRLSSFDNVKIKNNNPILYNVTGADGLKAGTTNRSGNSLASSLPVKDSDGNLHEVVAIELGAESTTDRGSYSEVLIRYGRQQVESGQHGLSLEEAITQGENQTGDISDENDDTDISQSAENETVNEDSSFIDDLIEKLKAVFKKA